MVREAEWLRPHDSLETKEDHPWHGGGSWSDAAGKATDGDTEEWLKGEVSVFTHFTHNGACLVAKRKYKLGRPNTGVIVRVRSLRRQEVMEPELGSNLALGQEGGREASMDIGWQVSVEK